MYLLWGESLSFASFSSPLKSFSCMYMRCSCITNLHILYNNIGWNLLFVCNEVGFFVYECILYRTCLWPCIYVLSEYGTGETHDIRKIKNICYIYDDKHVENFNHIKYLYKIKEDKDRNRERMRLISYKRMKYL